MRWVAVTIAGVLWVQAGVRGQAQTPPPVDPPMDAAAEPDMGGDPSPMDGNAQPDGPQRGDGGPPMMDGSPPPWGPMGGPPEGFRMRMREAIEFARQHSPQRAAEFDTFPRGTPNRRRVAMGLVARYQAMQTIRERSERLFELALERLQLEDQAWGLGKQIRMAPSEDEKRRLGEQLRPVVRQLVDKHFDEREARLARLREMVSREEQKLSKDRGEVDTLVTKQMERIVQDETFLLAPPPEGGGPGRPGGPGGPGRPGGMDGPGAGRERGDGSGPGMGGPPPGNRDPREGPRGEGHRPRGPGGEGGDRPPQ